jgi:DNA polymerase-3 subunit epsilon
MLSDLTKSLIGRQVTNPDFSFLNVVDTSGEYIAMHCEASSYDLARAELRALTAIPVQGQRILTSRHLSLTITPETDVNAAMAELLHFIGSRPLIGYYLDFTIALIDKFTQPMIGIALPNRRIEVSGLYYDQKLRVFSGGTVDLRLNSIVRDLALPERQGAGAFSDALFAALIYLRIRGAEHP